MQENIRKRAKRINPDNWKEEDLRFIRENANKLTSEKIAAHLGFTEGQVRWIMRVHGIKKDISSVISYAFASGLKKHPMTGKKASIESIEKRIETIRKRYSPMPSWNRGLTKGTDERIRNYGIKVSTTKKGVKQPNISQIKKRLYKEGKLKSSLSELWKNKEFREINIKRMKENNPMRNVEVLNRANSPENMQKRLMKMLVRPTRPEKEIMHLIEKHHLPFKYTGDGSIMIAGFNPDFIDEKSKRIIEVNGNYWHNIPEIMEKDKRKYIMYHKNGYTCLIIWEKEIKENPEQCLEKIKKFSGVENGITI